MDIRPRGVMKRLVRPSITTVFPDPTATGALYSVSFPCR
jgi:hypothetical protein